MKRRDFLKGLGLVVGVVGTGATAILKTADAAAGVETIDIPEAGLELKDGLFVPEKWAQESLEILEENMAIGEIVHRDFESKFVDLNKLVDLDWAHLLDQFVERDFDRSPPPGDYERAHLYCAFTICDSDRYKRLEDIMMIHAEPALRALANEINRTERGIGSLWPSAEPLPLPPSTMGVLAGWSVGGRIPVRVTLTYDASICGTKVVIDCLMVEMKREWRGLLDEPAKFTWDGRTPLNPKMPRGFA